MVSRISGNTDIFKPYTDPYHTLLHLQSNSIKYSPPLRGHLSKAVTFSGSLKSVYNTNKSVLKGHLT